MNKPLPLLAMLLVLPTLAIAQHERQTYPQRGIGSSPENSKVGTRATVLRDLRRVVNARISSPDDLLINDDTTGTNHRATLPLFVLSENGNGTFVWGGGVSEGTYGYAGPLFMTSIGVGDNATRPVVEIENSTYYVDLEAGGSTLFDLATDSSGNTAVIWDQGLAIQRFDKRGVPLGSLIAVGDPGQPGLGARISMNRSGEMLVAWAKSGILYQRFDRHGGKIGTPIRINQDSIGVYVGYHVRVAIDEEGRGAILWSASRYDSSNLFLVRCDKDGRTLGTPVAVNDTVSGYIWDLSISLDPNGDAVIVWRDRSGAWRLSRFDTLGVSRGRSEWLSTGDPHYVRDRSGRGFVVNVSGPNGRQTLFLQQVDASGKTVGLAKAVNEVPGTVMAPRTVIDSSGNVGVAWWTDAAIRTQWYDPAGNTVGQVRTVNELPVHTVQNVWLASTRHGDAVLAWSSPADLGRGIDSVTYQILDRFGNPVGNNRFVFLAVSGSNLQDHSQVSAGGEGNATVVWQDGRAQRARQFFSGMRGGDIFVQSFDSANHRRGVNRKINDDRSADEYRRPRISTNRTGQSVVAWTEGPTYSLVGDIYAQWISPVGTLIGGNRRVNQGVYGSYPSLSVDDMGRSVFVWGYAPKIMMQSFDELGSGIGGNIVVSDSTGNGAVALAPNGDGVVAWITRSGVFAQRINVVAGLLGVPWEVSTSQEYMLFLQAGVDSSGRATVVWSESSGTYVRRYDAAGQPLGETMKLTTDHGNGLSLSVTRSGKAVVAWSEGWSYYPSYGVRVQRIDVNGNLHGSTDDLIADGSNFSVSANDSVIFLSYTADRRGKLSDIYLTRLSWNDGISTGHERDESTAPSAMELGQNYPNPFNPTTEITYRLPSTGYCRLAVFDLLGREVAVLVDDQQPAGNYRVTWNAERVSSGLYVCRLSVGVMVQTRKMILLR